MFNGRRTGLDALFDRPKPSQWSVFFASPLIYLAKIIYYLQRPRQTTERNQKAITVICISDTHNTQPQVPYGDLLIHAGDLTQSGSVEEIEAALKWLKSLNHPHKVVVAGNHDFALDSGETGRFQWDGIRYLQDDSTNILFSNGRVMKIFGSPWTPTPGTWAFQHPPDKDVWTSKVPDDTDILVTHRPPRFHLDAAGFGDGNLLQELWRVRPRLHIFGHIHEGYGRDFLIHDQFELWYEDILRGSGGFLVLLRMFGRFIELKWRGRPAAGTELVNAAIIGGMKDDERRNAITVSL